MHLVARVRHCLVAAVLIGGTSAWAYEVDNFTARETLTQDALPVLDAEVNRVLERAVREANKESPRYCSKALLRQEIVRWTGPDPVSFLELWSTMSGKVQTTGVGLKESIYAGAGIGDSLAMYFGGVGRSFKLAGHVVGSDKLGHFFMQGLSYFKQVWHEGRALDDVLRKEHGELGLWGMKMTGVKSYADMAANYQGYRFWSELYQGETPYVRCEQGKGWAKVRDFTWLTYVNDSWDEAINCSELRPSLAAKVKTNLAKLGVGCPVDPYRCIELRKLDKSEFFLNPSCAVF